MANNLVKFNYYQHLFRLFSLKKYQYEIIFTLLVLAEDPEGVLEVDLVVQLPDLLPHHVQEVLNSGSIFPR